MRLNDVVHSGKTHAFTWQVERVDRNKKRVMHQYRFYSKIKLSADRTRSFIVWYLSINVNTFDNTQDSDSDTEDEAFENSDMQTCMSLDILESMHQRILNLEERSHIQG